jgi:hypothetical protein
MEQISELEMMAKGEVLDTVDQHQAATKLVERYLNNRDTL